MFFDRIQQLDDLLSADDGSADGASTLGDLLREPAAVLYLQSAVLSSPPPRRRLWLQQLTDTYPVIAARTADEVGEALQVCLYEVATATFRDKAEVELDVDGLPYPFGYRQLVSFAKLVRHVRDPATVSRLASMLATAYRLQTQPHMDRDLAKTALHLADACGWQTVADLLDAVGLGPVGVQAHRHGSRSYDLNQLANSVVAELSVRAPLQAIDYFIGTLRSYFALEDVRDEAAAMWRPSIGKASGMETLLDVFVDAAVNSSLQATKAGLGEYTMERLLGAGLYTTTRIALHVASVEPNRLLPQVSRVLERLDDFHSRQYEVELRALVAAAFPVASPAVRGSVLRWIDRGPDIPDGAKHERADIERYRALWIRDWLTACGVEHLPGPYVKKLRQLGAELPSEATTFADRGVRSGWVRQEGPISADQIRQADVSQLAGMLNSAFAEVDGGSRWIEEFAEVSLSGLEGLLKEVFREDLTAWFRRLQPPEQYDRRVLVSLLDAVADAIRTRQLAANVDAAEVMELISDALEAHGGADIARATLDVISQMLEAGPVPLPVTASMATILLALDSQGLIVRTDDFSDPVMASINAPDGIWTQSACALLYRIGGATSGGRDGALEMAKEMVLKAVSWDNAPSRAAIGRWLGRMYAALPDWTSSAVLPKVFAPEVETRLFYSAWTGYVRFSPVIDNLERLVLSSYSRALSVYDTSSTEAEQDLRSMAERLVVLLARGALAVEDGEAGVVEEFFDHVPVGLRHHMIAFVGASLAKSGALPAEVEVRLRRFLEWRLERLRGPEANERDRSELRGFGWWFVSGAFNQEWSIRTLVEVAMLAGAPEPDDTVLERFAATARTHPHDAVAVLEGFLKHPHEPWQPSQWREPALQILQTVLDLGLPELRERAKILADEFGQRGLLEFRRVFVAA